MRSSKRIALTLVATVAVISNSYAQDSTVTPQPNTLWRFIGIPQGIQKIRDVSVNRRGNHPGLERKPAMKRIADPSNLASENPAIKAAAEIKQAEDMKAQKIKAIKYLATIGCGCYDKDGKITEALLAATDDCTPDVRLASIEAVESAIDGGGCQKCGSTSCCNEKISKRLSEMAYERDDSGCPLEPSAEIRAAAKRVLCKCCPGRVSSDMIEEEYEPIDALSPVPTRGPDAPIKAEERKVKGESSSDDEKVRGESRDDREDVMPEPKKEDLDDTNAEPLAPTKAEELILGAVPTVSAEFPPVAISRVKLIGGMAVEPMVISPTSFLSETDETASTATHGKRQ